MKLNKLTSIIFLASKVGNDHEAISWPCVLWGMVSKKNDLICCLCHTYIAIFLLIALSFLVKFSLWDKISCHIRHTIPIYLCSCWNIVFYPTRIVSCDIVACGSSHQYWHWHLQPGWLINPTAGVFYMLLLNSTFLHLFVPCMLWYCCTLFCILLIILFNMCMLWYLLLKC